MKKTETTMEQMDNYFENKSQSEKWMIILVLAGLVGYILYLYLYPYAESKYKASLAQKKKLEKKIREEKIYLRSITVNGDRNFYVKKYDRDIANRKKMIEGYKQRITLLNQSFQRLSEVLFNKKNWSKFLDSITDRAHQNDVEILELTNHYVTGKTNFGHVLEVGIRCTGQYQGILSFINDLEQNKLVTDVTGSDITIAPDQRGIVADLNVSVWGVNR
ncbi:type 4a pilus biogenesis protein PilO [Nitratifractor sp.]